MLRAQDLDRTITLRHRTMTRNAIGENVASFADYATVRAQKVDLRGREYFAARQMQADITTRFRIYFRTDVTVLDVISCEAKLYDVQQVSEIGFHDGLELICRAFVA